MDSNKIYKIEMRIRNIFSKDTMSKKEVEIGVRLIDEYKFLTNHREDTRNPIKC